MSPKQMYRAVREHGISIVHDRNNHIWWAGDAEVGSPIPCAPFQVGSEEHTAVEVLLDVGRAGSRHCGTKPEEAVEDYCNARNLRWDV